MYKVECVKSPKLFVDIAVFVDTPPNSHYERIKRPPLSYSYSVPVDRSYSHSQVTFPAGKGHDSSGDRILTPDISKRQRPLPPVPRESDRSDRQWVKTCGKMCSGRSQWYYRVENVALPESSGSDSDSLEDEEKKLTFSTSDVIFRTPPSHRGSPRTSTAKNSTREAKNSTREPCPPSVTSRNGKMTAPAVPQPLPSSTVDPSAYSYSCHGQKPSNSSVRPPGDVNSGMRHRCGSYKRSSNYVVSTSNSSQPEHSKTEEDHRRLVR